MKCACGCGQTTKLAVKTSKARGVEKGQPQKFMMGHYVRTTTPVEAPEWYTDGLCKCGCGGEPPVSKVTDNRTGNVRGWPVRYIRGHHRVGVARPPKPKPVVSELRLAAAHAAAAAIRADRRRRGIPVEGKRWAA